jgi:hypothetical protein
MIQRLLLLRQLKMGTGSSGLTVHGHSARTDLLPFDRGTGMLDVVDFKMIQKWALSSLLLSCRCFVVLCRPVNAGGRLIVVGVRLLALFGGTNGTTGRLLYMGTRLWSVHGWCVLW